MTTTDERSGTPETQTDEQCMRDLVENRPDALKPLFARYAPVVFHMALQSLDPGTAEEIVQDVFLSVWRKSHTFDPKKGSFRPWLLQIAHYRILNELRTRSRRPRADFDADLMGEIKDPHDGPAEEAWQSFRKEAVRAAVNRLPPAQRQALSLAFFDDLSHDQVAVALKLPVGTVKTRIRTGIRKLRFLLTPVGVAAVAFALLIGGGIRFGAQYRASRLTDRALSMATSSDITTLHIPAAPGTNAATHGSYRGRPGTSLAVIALHEFSPAPRGKTYQAWVRTGDAWVSMGTAEIDSGGNGLVVAEGSAYTALPREVEVTLEPRGGSSSPQGPVMLHYTAP